MRPYRPMSRYNYGGKIVRAQEGASVKPSRQEKKQEMQRRDMEARKYMTDYMNSPRYREMAQQSASQSGVDAQQLMDQRRAAYESLGPTINKMRESKSVMASYNPYKHQVTTRGTRIPSNVNVHEFSHVTDLEFGKYGGMGIPESDVKLMTSMANPIYTPFRENYMEGTETTPPTPEQYLESIKGTPQFEYFVRTFVPKDVQNVDAYLNSAEGKETLSRAYMLVAQASVPIETRARLNAMRQMAKEEGIYDPFTEKATPESVDKLIGLLDKDPDKFNQIRQMLTIYTPEQIQEMLNRISYEPDQNAQDSYYI